MLPAELLLFTLPPIGRLFDGPLSSEVKAKGSGVKQSIRQTSQHSNKSFAFKHKFYLTVTNRFAGFWPLALMKFPFLACKNFSV